MSRAEELDNISILYLLQTKAPARSAGYVVLVQETLNMAIESRRAWTYSPGTRRVRRAPTIAYDNPGTIIAAKTIRRGDAVTIGAGVVIGNGRSAAYAARAGAIRPGAARFNRHV